MGLIVEAHFLDMQNELCFYVYILECSNGSFYTGYTNDLAKRFQAHLTGKANCKYTRSFPPIRIAQSWQFTSKSLAMTIEAKLKKLSKLEKLALINQPHLLHRLGCVAVLPKSKFG